MGIEDEEGYGNSCENVKAGEQPFCYVNKAACDYQGVTWAETTMGDIDTNLVGKSLEICASNALFPKIIKKKIKKKWVTQKNPRFCYWTLDDFTI